MGMLQVVEAVFDEICFYCYSSRIVDSYLYVPGFFVVVIVFH